MPRFRTGGEESRKRLVIRLFAVGGFFAVCFGILISRAVFFHLKDNSEIERVAMRQYRTAVQKSTERGKILDTAGRDLAINVPTESAFADPRFIKDRSQVAATLASIMNLPVKKLEESFSSNRKFVWIKRKVTTEEASQIAQANLPGIFLMTENSRSYPNGSLASSVLGAVGVDAEGLAGIEFHLNDALLVSNERKAYKRDALGHLYLSPSAADEKQKPSHVELTIDKMIQYVVERELAAAVAGARAKSGVVVVLDTQSGDILAMATSPTFDPNKFEKHSQEEWKNRAIADAYEPGSTFKAVVVAGALDGRVVDTEQIFDCGMGKLVVGKDIVRDAHPHGRLSVADIIKVSSNIGAARVESKLGKERVYEYLKKFGFGDSTGIDLPGESSGILSSPKSWSDVQFVTIAFGQGISATPLQMALAFAAIANGGELLRPHIVKRVVGPDGEVVYERKKEIRSAPINAETAAVMRRLLERVVGQGGTGMLAASQEYPVGGKTGTAQKAAAHGGYAENKYYSSFIGFAPSNDPHIVVYVGIDEPKGYYYGGQVAAPVFRRIVDETLHYMGVPAQKRLIEASVKIDSNMFAEGPSPVQSVAESSDAASEAATVSLKDNTTAGVALVAPRSKEPSVEISRIISEGKEKWKIPDYAGLTMRGVLEATGPGKIALKFVGTGVAVKQNPPAGSVVESGAECTVEFRPMM